MGIKEHGTDCAYHTATADQRFVRQAQLVFRRSVDELPDETLGRLRAARTHALSFVATSVDTRQPATKHDAQ